MPLTRRASALLSRAPSPRTPSTRSPVQQPLHISSTDNRKSSDSWNSSNYDPADDPDSSGNLNTSFFSQGYVHRFFTRPLTIHISSSDSRCSSCSRTHPLHWPVPPSNLLDKIARNVAHAKGPSDWPYSLRSTRAKLVDLCRVRAKEVSAEQRRYNTIEEEDMDQDLEQFREVLKRTTNIRRPLYRQNSMDFMQSAKLELRRTDAFSRTSHRLRQSDHLFPNPAYPHTRPSSADSQTLNISTPSSTTLISCDAAEPQWKAQPSRSSIRRSVSTMSSSTSSSSLRSLPLAPVRRADSFGEARKCMKRVPSFSVAAKDST
ncbi:hypothetical protein BJV77DRAFT_280235 [Russula vinacea]|nr:hypothetical protein BJV77DRAFT_280235 [Russula vinacea]